MSEKQEGMSDSQITASESAVPVASGNVHPRFLDRMEDLSKKILGWGIVLVFVGAIIAKIFSSLVDTYHSLGPMASLEILLGVSIACGLIWVFRKPLTEALILFFRRLMKLIYYLVVIAYYLLLAAAIFSFVAHIFAELDSFLASPLGTKADFVDYGFGGSYLLFGGAAFVAWIVYKGARGIKAAITEKDALGNGREPRTHGN